jgi:hypothetical protein
MSWRTECCPDGTLSKIAVPYCSVKAKALGHVVLVDNQRMHEPIIHDSTIIVIIRENSRGNQGVTYAWNSLRSPQRVKSSVAT